jgi:U3 small nucleolar RNA-associated protein 21
VEQEEDLGTETRRFQTLSSVGLDVESDFARRLRLALHDDQMDSLFLYLHSLSPPALDSEIRSLARVTDVTAFFQCMIKRLQEHLDYDAIQAMVSVALKIHSTLIIENAIKGGTAEGKEEDMEMELEFEGDDQEQEGRELGQTIRQLMIEQYKEGNRVLELLQYCMGSLAFVRDLPLS